MIPVELPEKYYLDYFESLLHFVQQKYKALLSREEKSFIRRFHRLPEEARCLYVRLINRRGCYFRVERLQYAEIRSLDTTLQLLVKKNFFTSLSASHTADAAGWLNIFTKAELINFLASTDKTLKKRANSLKKEALLSFLQEKADIALLLQQIVQKETVVRVNYEREVEMLKFLYFGSIHGDMTQFVIRDIGYRKMEELDTDKMQALFKTRQEAEDKLLISKLYQTFKDMREQQPPEQLYDWFEGQNLYQREWCALAKPTFDKLCLRLGRLLERQQLPTFALDVYRHTQAVPSRERRVRLLHKLGLTSEALQLCRQIGDSPQNAEEKYFATDFCDLLNKKRKVKHTTHYLQSSESIALPESTRTFVELGVLEYYQDLGYEGVFSENYLWRGFFGLFFWDIIFDQDSEALHNPLQTTPSDFYTADFLPKRKKQIDQRLEALAYPERFLNIVRHHFQTKQGISNPMVGWHESLLPLVEKCYEKMQPQQISSVLLEMAGNLRENTRGFPDLFVWKEESYGFIEVKSPNDHLSAQQLYWLHFFERHKINAQVIRVQWKD